ncbi:uncharacterized protein LOC141602056 [Silene latifolia]|uniref:uncharacterized protein LOC141602056 n=1 Tax=Silene latifolia TaxID=37657 RepID=UPI003D7766BC
MAWNCRGLNNVLAPAIQKIRALCRANNNLDFVFLSETKCSVRSVDVLLRPLGFQCSVGCDADGTKGGLWVGWKPSSKLKCVFISCNLIILVVNQCMGSIWYLCCVYGDPNHAGRNVVWDMFDQQLARLDKPFLLFGDFNQVEFSSDKLGGSSQGIRGADLFTYWKNKNCLMDIPFKGPKFTWCNNRESSQRIYERIDKGYASVDWISFFPNTFIKHLPIQISDHAPIIIDTNMTMPMKRKVYRLEAWCFNYEECGVIVKQNWCWKDRGDDANALCGKLCRVKNALRIWACNKKDEWSLKWSEFDKELKCQLYEIEKGGDCDKYISCHKKLMEFSKAAGIYWKQRVKIKWQCEGDICTKYFFNWVKGRSGANTILGIKKNSNEWTFDLKEIGGLFLNHFKSIYNCDQEVENFEHYMSAHGYLLDNLRLQISEEEKLELGRDYSKGEVRKAVFQLGPLKSPGPDGIHAAFYQKYWAVVKDDVVKGALFILNTGGGGALMVHFWWRGAEDRKAVHWCSKEFLSKPVGEGGLGIRNVVCFNQALVAKVAWRVFFDTNSLISKTIGPKLGFIDSMTDLSLCGVPNTSSWALKSLYWGLELIMANIGWKVGFPSKLRVWNDSWIEGNCLSQLIDSQFHDRIDNSLLEGEQQSASRDWDLSRFDFDLGVEIRKKILATFIPLRNTCDAAYWKLSKGGRYSVKTGYYAALDSNLSRSSTRADVYRMNPHIVSFCKGRLWKLPISLKWRLFIWKFLANALPLGIGFLKRKLDYNIFCTLCQSSDNMVETVNHLFMDCRFAQPLWFGCQLGLKVPAGIDIDVRIWFINWINYFVKCDNSRSLIFTLVATLWRIWCCRNERVFRKHCPSPLFALRSVVEDVQGMHEAVEWKTMNSGGSGEVRDLIPADDHHKTDLLGSDMVLNCRNCYPFWIVGQSGCDNVFRMKCDAAWKDDRSAGLGWFILDMYGVRRGEGSHPFMASSPLQAEGFAMLHGLRWARENGILHLHLDTDCLNLVLQMIGAELPDMAISFLLNEIKSEIVYFQCCSLSYCPRGVNRIAHSLAQRALL